MRESNINPWKRDEAMEERLPDYIRRYWHNEGIGLVRVVYNDIEGQYEVSVECREREFSIVDNDSEADAIKTAVEWMKEHPDGPEPKHP